jgi:hypothetical protein
MLQKKNLIAILIMLQKKTFGQKNFEFHAQVQKCHFSKKALARIEKLFLF